MRNEEIIEEIISENAAASGEHAAVEAPIRFLVFRIADTIFALHAERVREIVLGAEVYFLPFAPPYVRGLINRHGEPNTVLDLNSLFRNALQDSEKFLIIKDESQTALMIGEVLEIRGVPEGEFRLTGATDEESRFFFGSFALDDEEVLVLNPEGILEKLKSDLRA